MLSTPVVRLCMRRRTLRQRMLAVAVALLLGWSGTSAATTPSQPDGQRAGEGTCECGREAVTGNEICFVGEACTVGGADECDTSADCGPGAFCLTNATPNENCCERRVCVDSCGTSCPGLSGQCVNAPPQSTFVMCPVPPYVPTSSWPSLLALAMMVLVAGIAVGWRRSRAIRRAGVASLAIALLVCAATAGAAHAGEVHGFVSSAWGSGPGQPGIETRIRIPEVTVYLKTVPGGVAGPQVVTNAHGAYEAPPHAPGSYQLCVEATGFATSCDPTPIALTAETYLPTKDALIGPLTGVIRGQIRLADGTPCYHENVFFERLEQAEVSLLDMLDAVVAGPVPANDLGQYVLPEIPGPGSYKLRATYDNSVVEQTVSLSAAALTGHTDFDLTVANSSPKILGITPSLGGNALRSASPGSTLQVALSAVSPGGHPLHYRWGDGTPSFVSTDTSTISWTIASTSATNVLFVEVTDNLGGFANGHLTVPGGSGNAKFAGTVSTLPGSTPLSGATVTVNGTAATTNAGGQFLVNVAESPRYVLTIKQQGYALMSRIFYGSTTGLQLVLSPSQHTAFDAAKKRVIKFAPKVKPPKGRKKIQAKIKIDGTKLVDENGDPPIGSINGYLFAYDLDRPNAIPGDLSATTTGSQDVRLESFGAVDVRFVDDANQPLNLMPGATADIQLSIQRDWKTAPATIPLFTYDETAGYWRQEGTLTKSGSKYRGTVQHFSSFNADAVFTDTACIKLVVADTPTTSPPRLAPPFPFRLHVSYPTSTSSVNHNDFQVTEAINGLFRLPANTDVTLEIHPGSGPDAVLRSFTVKSGAAISNAFDGFPPLPYDACNGFDPNQTPNQPVFLAVDVPPHAMVFLTRKGVGSTQEAADYYNTNAGVTTDATNSTCTGPKCTLAGWKTANAFDGTEPAVAYYYNGGDLGLGREMHCRQNGADIACYVTNYGSPGGDSDSAIADAINHNAPIATVAMEYVAAAGPTGVKFYVYNHATGDALANQAILDSEGPKNVPHLCIQCHGGQYNSSTNLVSGSSFLPFDVFSFGFNSAVGVTLAAQQEPFRKLNQLMKATLPNPLNAHNPIGNLIDGWYPCGVGSVGCTAVGTYVPPPPAPGWPSKPDLYKTVVAPYCRTCHVSQSSFGDWTLESGFVGFASSIDGAVCGSSRYMPHAEVTFKKFWLSTNPHGPAYLADSALGLNLSGCPN